MFSKFWQKIFPSAEIGSDQGQPIKTAPEINHPEAVVNNNPEDSAHNDHPVGNQLSSESEIKFSEPAESELAGSSNSPESDDLEIKL